MSGCMWFAKGACDGKVFAEPLKQRATAVAAGLTCSKLFRNLYPQGCKVDLTPEPSPAATFRMLTSSLSSSPIDWMVQNMFNYDLFDSKNGASPRIQ